MSRVLKFATFNKVLLLANGRAGDALNVTNFVWRNHSDVMLSPMDWDFDELKSAISPGGGATPNSV